MCLAFETECFWSISQRRIPGADGPFRSWRRYIEDSIFLMTDARLMELRAEKTL